MDTGTQMRIPKEPQTLGQLLGCTSGDSPCWCVLRRGWSRTRAGRLFTRLCTRDKCSRAENLPPSLAHNAGASSEQAREHTPGPLLCTTAQVPWLTVTLGRLHLCLAAVSSTAKWEQ